MHTIFTRFLAAIAVTSLAFTAWVGVQPASAYDGPAINTTGPWFNKPWYSGGAIEVWHRDGSKTLCSTAGLGRYKREWALLTAGHCGAPLDPVYSAPDGWDGPRFRLGTIVYKAFNDDIAIVRLSNQSDYTYRNGFARITSDGPTASSHVRSGADTVIRENTKLFKFGIRTQETSGRVQKFSDAGPPGGSQLYDHVHFVGGFYGVPQDFMDKGDSGAGVFTKRNGVWLLVGIVSWSDGGTDYIAPIAPAIKAGFDPFRKPSRR